jgi:hypothetical protein
MTDARACRGCRFPAEVILWAVRWYLQFPLSESMQFRGGDHAAAGRAAPSFAGRKPG